MVLLTAISVVAVAALFVALAVFLRAIAELEDIGGQATASSAPANYLSKIRLGVRAIERQTEHGAAGHEGSTRPQRIRDGLRRSMPTWRR